jgi:hypothetical protein
MREQVNHPQHYNSHPAGIECISVIRHYTCDISNAIKYLWRAGLKPELGKDDADKEIEDLHKAVFYISDFLGNEKELKHYRRASAAKGYTDYQVCLYMVYSVTGYSVQQITLGYDPNVAAAMRCLLQVGIINGDGEGGILLPRTWRSLLKEAAELIHKRILDIEMMVTAKELHDTCDVLRGYGVEGEEYVIKPGCERSTEPERYDPLNMLVSLGKVYCLVSDKREKPNGALYSPCDNCALRDQCLSQDGTAPSKDLCHLHLADSAQYYLEVGYARYNPHYGTVEVIDEYKEMEEEARRTLDNNDY